MPDTVMDKATNQTRKRSNSTSTSGYKGTADDNRIDKEEFRILGCKHVLNAQFSIYAKCCDKWFVCR